MPATLCDQIAHIKREVSGTGKSGLVYGELIEKLGLKESVGLYIARKHLLHDGYSFKFGDDDVDLISASSIGAKWTCIPPAEVVRKAMGYLSHEDNLPDFEEGHAVLSKIAKAGARGAVMVEIESNATLRKNVANVVDRLVSSGVLIKRLVIPDNSKSKKRVNAVCTILHLKKFAKFFRPELDGLYVQPDETVRDDVLRFFRRTIEQHQLAYLPTADLSLFINVHKRHIQYLRTVIFQATRQGEQFPVNFVEQLCAPVNRRNNRKFTRFRYGWCIVLGPITGDRDRDIAFALGPDVQFDRLRDLGLYEQIDWRLRRSVEGLSANDLRRFIGTGRKRTTKLGEELIKVFGYPAIKVQEAKSLVYRYQSKQPLLANYVHSNGNSKYDDNDDLSNTPLSTPHLPSLSTAPALSVAAAAGTCAMQTNRELLILQYLLEHPVHTGSALEVGHLVRVQTLESQLDYKVDKKTIRRTIDKMAAENILTLHHEPASETFQRICGRNVQDMVFLLLNLQHPALSDASFQADVKEMSTQERIAWYLDHYEKPRHQVRRLAALSTAASKAAAAANTPASAGSGADAKTPSSGAAGRGSGRSNGRRAKRSKGFSSDEDDSEEELSLEDDSEDDDEEDGSDSNDGSDASSNEWRPKSKKKTSQRTSSASRSKRVNVARGQKKRKRVMSSDEEEKEEEEEEDCDSADEYVRSPAKRGRGTTSSSRNVREASARALVATAAEAISSLHKRRQVRATLKVGSDSSPPSESLMQVESDDENGEGNDVEDEEQEAIDRRVRRELDPALKEAASQSQEMTGKHKSSKKSLVRNVLDNIKGRHSVNTAETAVKIEPAANEDSEQGKKRKRRTKAQIEADRLLQQQESAAPREQMPVLLVYADDVAMDELLLWGAMPTTTSNSGDAKTAKATGKDSSNENNEKGVKKLASASAKIPVITESRSGTLFLSPTHHRASSTSTLSMRALPALSSTKKTASTDQTSAVPTAEDTWPTTPNGTSTAPASSSATPAPASHEDANTPQIGAAEDDFWTKEQDVQLLEHFLVSLLVRSARLGLPNLLKPAQITPSTSYSTTVTTTTTTSSASKKTPAKHAQSQQSQQSQPPQTAKDLVIHAWDSVLDVDFGAWDLRDVRNYYVLSVAIKTASHSLSSCRRRMPLLLRQFDDVRSIALHLVAYHSSPSVASSSSSSSSSSGGLSGPLLDVLRFLLGDGGRSRLARRPEVQELLLRVLKHTALDARSLDVPLSAAFKLEDIAGPVVYVEDTSSASSSAAGRQFLPSADKTEDEAEIEVEEVDTGSETEGAQKRPRISTSASNTNASASSSSLGSLGLITKSRRIPPSSALPTAAPAVITRRAVLTTRHALTLILLRELYLHGMLRRVGSDEADTPLNPLGTRFLFPATFLCAGLDKPLGSFFHDRLLLSSRAQERLLSSMQSASDSAQGVSGSGVSIEDAVVLGDGIASSSQSVVTKPRESIDYRESRQLLHLLHHMHDWFQRQDVPQTEEMRRGTVNVPAEVAALRIEVYEDGDEVVTEDGASGAIASSSSSNGSRRRSTVVDEISGLNVSESSSGSEPARVLLKTSEQTTITASAETQNQRRAYDRVQCRVSYDVEAQRAQQDGRLLALRQLVTPREDERKLPWFDEATGRLRMDVLQVYLVQVMAYLGENPGASAQQLHACITLLPFPAVQSLLTLLVQQQFIEELRPTHAVSLSNAFGAMSIWGPKGGSISTSNSATVRYQLLST